ncbi:MAG: bifunctional riboflavin kinase/FAD synthetase [Kangiellaceae bacterium]|nr:bifunctional riboflavin kinase/FAD synthetase [Kangiellaceae bacterium]
MQLIRGLINLNHQADECVATIGNFDGIHLGHRAIIEKVIAHAKKSNHQSCVILFEPHPKEVFMGENCPARITNFPEKFHQLEELGVDKLLVLRFNKALRQMQAKDFIQRVLIEQLRIQHLVVGDDFQFGYKRQGNYQLLHSEGQGYYTVEPTPTLLIEDQDEPGKQHRVSSTLVRDALANNKLDFAHTLLARHYSMKGKVGYGKQLGRTIGFPTANIALKRIKTSLAGVYLVKAHWLSSDTNGKMSSHWGVANCGFRPTVAGESFKLEVYLFDVNPDLYGVELQVEFYRFLRGEMKFDGVESLTHQIQQDVDKAKSLINIIQEKNND